MNKALLGYRSLRWVCRKTPDAWARRICPVLSDLYRWLDRGRRPLVEENLRVMVGEKEAEIARCCREVYRSFASFLFEFFSGRDSQMEGENFDEQLRALLGAPGERAGLLLMPHVGNWEACLRHLLRRGYEVTTVVMPHGSEAVDSFFVQLRGHPRLEVTDLKRGGVVCRRALRKKRIVALACERDYTGSGQSIPFKGYRVEFPPGPAWLMLGESPSTFLVHCRRTDLHRFSIQLEPFTTGNNDPLPSLEELTEDLGQAIFKIVENNPEQWITFDRTFHPNP